MIEETLLKIARQISPLLPKFYLAGGTAIMFKHKHRISTDLDFFSYKWFSSKYYVKKIASVFPVSDVRYLGDNTDLFIENVKVSLVFFPFTNLKRTERIEGVRIASDYDLFLNKIYAAGRRIDSKDPFDIAFLYERYKWNLTQIKEDFEKKFPGQSFEIYLGAVLDFDSYPELNKETKQILTNIGKNFTKN